MATEPAPAEAPLAELGPRAVAFLIDWVAPAAAYWALAFVFDAISDRLAFLFAVAGWFGLVVFQLWNLALQGRTGQSVGKRIQGIKLVGLDNGGRPIGAARSVVRAALNTVACGLAGWLYAFVDARHQTLGDKLTRSVVVAA